MIIRPEIEVPDKANCYHCALATEDSIRAIGFCALFHQGIGRAGEHSFRPCKECMAARKAAKECR